MNLEVPVADALLIEVVANSLPLQHGSQLAIDVIIMSPLTRLGDAHPRADVDPGCALAAAARRKRHQPYTKLARARRCRFALKSVAVLAVWRWGGAAPAPARQAPCPRAGLPEPEHGLAWR